MLQVLPREPAAACEWLREQLGQTTARLAEKEMQHRVAEQLSAWVQSMEPGLELQHLHSLLRFCDHRGSDVRLWSGDAARISYQQAPYPAFRWRWNMLAAYPWNEEQHINVLEVAAVVNLVKLISNRESMVARRVFVVVDSLVAGSVIPKGRSSSRRLNRQLRQLAGYLLASDAYLIISGTVSCWNWSDAPSRLFEPGDHASL